MLHLRGQPGINTGSRKTKTAIRPVHYPRHPTETAGGTTPPTKPQIHNRMGARPHGHRRKRESRQRSEESGSGTISRRTHPAIQAKISANNKNNGRCKSHCKRTVEQRQNNCATTPQNDSTTKTKNRSQTIRRSHSQANSEPNKVTERPLQTKQIPAPKKNHRGTRVRMRPRNRNSKTLPATLQEVRKREERAEGGSEGKKH